MTIVELEPWEWVHALNVGARRHEANWHSKDASHYNRKHMEVVTDKSVIITFAVPVFFLLIIIEYFYGKYIGKNTYRLNDTITSITIGMISRFPTMLNLGVQSVIFIYISSYLNLELLSIKNPFI